MRTLAIITLTAWAWLAISDDAMTTCTETYSAATCWQQLNR